MTIDLPTIDLPTLVIPTWLIAFVLISAVLFAINYFVVSKLSLSYRQKRDLTMWNEPAWVFWGETISAGPVMWVMFLITAPKILAARRAGEDPSYATSSRAAGA